MGCSSVVQLLPCMYKALVSILCIRKKKKKKKTTVTIYRIKTSALISVFQILYKDSTSGMSSGKSWSPEKSVVFTNRRLDLLVVWPEAILGPLWSLLLQPSSREALNHLVWSRSLSVLNLFASNFKGNKSYV